MKKALVLKPEDPVAVCLADVDKGDLVQTEYEQIKALEDIPMPHKIARRDIAAGEPIYKYSYVIGYATKNIKRGQWVHTHNVSPNKPQ